MANGNIIFLNGTSSAGKTTLSHALQELMPEPYQHMALDQFRDGLPPRYRGLNAPNGSTGEQGLNVVPVREPHREYTAIRFGALGRQVLCGMRRGIAAMSACGVNVLVDDIIIEPDFLDDYLAVMDGLPLYFVGVRCHMDVINEREAARLGRFPGTAEGHSDICHAHGIYDVEVDTASMTPFACAEAVAARIAEGPPTAFAELRQKRQSV